MTEHPQSHEQDPEHTIFERRDPLIGTTLDGRFRIDARLAAGGFGAIYRATELASGRELALKVLHANLTADPSIVARFRREGETLATLRDPHTVTAYELGEAEDGTLYIVMELLRGETLHDAFREHGGPLPWRRVTAIARAVCSSLAEAHERGIVHRDLKPANIHLQERGGTLDFVKVLDFGIAKILRGSDVDPASELTVAGQMIGTFDYMAPEQMLGGVVGPRCDLYTLGVVMYEMITGRLPFAGANSPTHLLALLLTTEPPPLSARTPVPPALDRIVMRCLEREPQDRFPSVAQLAAALDRVLEGGAHEEATLTAIAQPIDHEGATRGARDGEARAATVPAGSPTRLTPTRGAQLRDAIAPAYPIEPIGDVRAQGSQPVIAPNAAPNAAPYVGGRASQPVHPPAQQPQRSSQPQPQLPPPAQHPHAQHLAYPHRLDPRVAGYPAAGAAGRSSLAMMPAYADPRSQPVHAPGPGPGLGHMPQPAFDPRAPHAIADGHGSQRYLDPRACQPAFEVGAPWQQPHQARRRADAGFDAARDAAVRRIVWALVLFLGCVLALVVAKLF